MRFLVPLWCWLDPGEGGGAGGGAPDPNKLEKPPEKPDPRDVELAELKKWRAEKEAADKAKTEEEAKKKGEWEGLHKQEKARADAAEARLAELEKEKTARLKALKGENEEALKILPKELQELAPAADDPEALAGWLKKASKTAADRPAGTRSKGDPPPKITLTDDEKAEAVRRGLTEDQWAKILVQSGRKKLPAEGK